MTNKTPQGNEKSIRQLLEDKYDGYYYKMENGEFVPVNMEVMHSQALKEIQIILDGVIGIEPINKWLDTDGNEVVPPVADVIEFINKEQRAKLNKMLK